MEESKRRTQEQLQRVDWALTGAAKQRGMVKRARKKQRKEASRIELEYRDLTDRERGLEREIQLLEASVARNELFRFVRSGRYEVKPMSLANAVANVPYSGWRQSMRRCKRLPSYLGDGPNFELLKSTRYLVAKASSKTESAFVNDIRAGIPVLPGRYKVPKEKLARDWFYVERAIRRAYRANPIVSALHFRIVSQYLKQIRSKTQAEMGLAEQMKIELYPVSTRSGKR